jgi:hypothetical protein
MSLEDLIKSDLSEEQFLSQHTAPALLISLPDESGEGAVDDTGMRTEVLSSTVIRTSLGQADELLLASSRLEWLIKSDRNPFSNLIMVGRTGTNDVVLGQLGVSKVHATFSHQGDEWFVQDGKSRNGTYLNGERLKAGEKRAVGDGDGIGFGGKVVARFLLSTSVWNYVQQFRQAP